MADKVFINPEAFIYQALYADCLVKIDAKDAFITKKAELGEDDGRGEKRLKSGRVKWQIDAKQQLTLVEI